MPEGIHSIIADINDEEAVAKAIALEHYDVVAQFIGYTAEDIKRDIRLFQNKNAAIHLYQQCLCLSKAIDRLSHY